MNPATRVTRVAIECLTLWLEPGPEARQQAAVHIADVVRADDPHLIIAGHLNLAMLLLLELVAAQGAEDLMAAGRAYLQTMSPSLPE